MVLLRCSCKNKINPKQTAHAYRKAEAVLGQTEAETFFLLPDCHHGELAMRVLAFLSRISFDISRCSGTTRVMCIANTLIRIFVRCLTWTCRFLLSFIAMSVRCRLSPAVQRGPIRPRGPRSARFSYPASLVLSPEH